MLGREQEGCVLRLVEQPGGRNQADSNGGPGILLVIPWEVKSLLATGVPRDAAEGRTGSTTVNYPESGGTCDKRGFGFGTTGK